MRNLLWTLSRCAAHNRRIRASASLILPRHTWRAALLCVLLAALLFAAVIMLPAHAEGAEGSQASDSGAQGPAQSGAAQMYVGSKARAAEGGTCDPTLEDKPTQYTISVEPGSALNFRAGPSTDAEILYQLGPGNTVTVRETSGGWALVTWTVLEPLDDPRPAWVCMEYLQPVEEVKPCGQT